MSSNDTLAALRRERRGMFNQRVSRQQDSPMRLEVAFSVQFDQFITAERAYELFWAGAINDKRAFRCSGNNCTAQVTCANLDALAHDLKVQPHYRPYGEHIDGCPFGEAATSPSASSRANVHGIGTQAAENPDIFDLSRPADHFVRSIAVELSSPRSIQKTASSGSTNTGRPRQRHYYSVTNLVQRWLRFRKLNRLSKVGIRIGTATLTYEQLFKGVYNQDVETLEHAKHIYWGKAWVKRLGNDTGYRIEFNEKMRIDGHTRRPSLFISDKMIEKYPLKKLLAKRLKTTIEKDKGGCIIFVYGAPIIVPDLDSATESDPYTRSFINFRVPNPDMLDIQNLSLFTQLRHNK